MASPRRKKLLLKDFVREYESKFTGKYPFLTSQQINAKLKQSWKKACREEINNRKSKSPVKNRSPVHHSKLITRENHSPKKRIQSPVELELESPLAGNDENDSEARSDSGGWYYESEGTLENTEEYPSPQTNGLTEEIVNDVKAHTLNIETKETPSEEKKNNSQKGEKVLSRLFHPMEKQQNIENSSENPRLLASEEKGESNFSGMFQESDFFL